MTDWSLNQRKVRRLGTQSEFYNDVAAGVILDNEVNVDSYMDTGCKSLVEGRGRGLEWSVTFESLCCPSREVLQSALLGAGQRLSACQGGNINS